MPMLDNVRAISTILMRLAPIANPVDAANPADAANPVDAANPADTEDLADEASDRLDDLIDQMRYVNHVLRDVLPHVPKDLRSRVEHAVVVTEPNVGLVPPDFPKNY